MWLPGLLLAALASLAGAGEPTDSDSDSPLFASPTRLDRIGRIMVPVMINGQGPFKLVVDTGASHSTISTQLAETLKLVPAEDSGVRVNGITGSALLPTVEVDRLQAGDLVIEHAHLPVIWTPVMADADGILGVAGLKDERLLVDFRHDRVVITRSFGRAALTNFLKISAKRVSGGLLMIPGRMGGVSVKAIIDTGSERTLGNRALQEALRARARRHDPTVDGITNVYGATSEISPGELEVAPPIKLDTVTLARVTVCYGDFHIFKVWDLEKEPAVIVGMDVLGTVYALGIDFAKSELYLRSMDQEQGTAITHGITMVTQGLGPQPW
jgi:predicted aspartyl protease